MKCNMNLTLSPEQKLETLGIVLPPPPPPVANFVAFRKVGPLLYLSGQGPLENGMVHVGTVGSTVDVKAAYRHARLTGLNLLAVAHAALGGLDKVMNVIKLLGFVNAVPHFTDHPAVIDGCSDLFVEVFGEQRGRSARSAIGSGSLPSNQTVEIEAIFEVTL